MMTTTVIVVVIVVIVVLPSGVALRLQKKFSGGGQLDLEAAAPAVRSVLESSPPTYCSTIFFTDGEISNTGVFKVVDEIAGGFGLGMLEWRAADGEANVTLNHLAQLVAVARKLRDYSRCLRVVVVSEDPAFLGAFGSKADAGRLLVWSTRVLLVTSLDFLALRELLASHWAFVMMNVMLLNLEDDPEILRWGVYSYFPYGPEGGAPGGVRLASWTQAKGLIPVAKGANLFPEKSANFYGAPVTLASNPFPPYWMESLEATTTPGGRPTKRYSGRGWLLLKAVSEKLNFTVQQIPTRDWIEVMDRIKDRSASISPVAYVVMPHQLATVDYTVFIEPDTLSFSMAKPSRKPRWQSLYYPLRPLTWLLILLALALVPFALFTVSRMTPREAEERPVNLSEVIQEVIGTLLGQNLSGRLPDNDSVRVFLGAWLVFALVLETAYRGNLTAFLTIPKYPARVETLHQLIEFGAKATVPMDDGDDLIQFFKESGSRKFQLLAERAYKVQDTVAGLRQATEKREAYIYVRKLMEALIAEHFTDANGRAKLYVARENISPGFAAWPIMRDAPFKPALDWCIMALLEAGLPEKWMEQMLEEARTESRIRQRAHLQETPTKEEQGVDTSSKKGQVSRVFQPLTLTHIQGPLLLLLLGLLLSLVFIILELLMQGFLRTR